MNPTAMNRNGFKFRVLWAATGLVETINGRDYEHAERRIKRRYRDAVAFCFVGECDPLPVDAKPTIKKVF